MERFPRPELQALETTQTSPPNNMPNEPPLMSPAFSLAAVPPVYPEPAYIAASAASQIVTSEYRDQHPGSDDETSSPLINEIALVAPAPLSLINAFLDRLLFNFLASSRSTSLASLRPAVTEVLKPRLAREAIAGADEELQEFLGGGDDEELLDFHNGQESEEDWDLELAWKRTRLRCMVYTRLGDMEEEDEDMYIEQERLENPTAPRRLSREIGIVSPAVAIFLTSILEFIGEQALMIAGDAAYKRYEVRSRNERRRSSVSQRVIVEETDMEKVALNPTLGRLWRSWRKLLRSPRTSVSRIMSRESVSHRGLPGFSTSRSTSRKSSIGAADGFHGPPALQNKPSVAELPTEPDPSSVPLPLTDYDVEEIEVPGYSPNNFVKPATATGDEPRRQSVDRVAASDQDRWHTGAALPAASPPRAARTHDLRIDTSHAYPSRTFRSRSLPTPTKATFAAHFDGSDQVASSTVQNIPRGLSNEGVQSRVEQDSGSSDHAENTRMTSTLESAAVMTAPFHGSVLNTISRHAARELEGSSETNSEDDNQDDKSRELKQEVQHDDADVGISGSSKPLLASLAKPREDAQTRYSTSSSVRTHTAYDVSPIEPNFVDTGEVSPMEPSDDESEVFGLKPPPAGTLRRTTERARLITAELSRGQVMRVPEPVNLGTPEQQPSSAHSPQARQRGMDGPTEDDYAKDEKREAFVVLEDVPIADSTRSSDASMLSGREMQVNGVTLAKSSRPPGPENGVPPLTPLREMVEAAHDTSDEASMTAGHAERVRQSPKSTSLALSGHAQSSSASDGTKLSQLRHKLPAVYTETPAVGVERSTVQRVPNSSGAHRDPTTPQGRSSDDSIRDLRSAYAATSAASPASVKVVPRSGSMSGASLGPVTSRTSSEGSKATSVERHHRRRSSSIEKEHEFEQLMKSDETLHINLTPQNMRELEVSWKYVPSYAHVVQRKLTYLKGPDSSPRSPSYQSSSRTGHVVNMVRSGRNSAEPARPATMRSHASSVSKEVKRAIESGPTLVIHSGPPVKRGPQAVARDARVEVDTTRDFADFIRSTGPEPAKSLPNLPAETNSRPTSSRPTTALYGARNSSGSGPRVPRTLVKSSTGVNPIIEPLISENKALKKNSSRLQPRDATISRNDESSDLIDFIRQGPPLERNDANRRIPRTVAPFRNTMESDEIEALGHSKAKDSNSMASTVDSLVTKSLHSSVNSRTGLLDTSNRQTTKALTSPPVSRRPHRFDEPAQPPMRKQRRVKDPYNIDYTDEEDEESHTPKPQNQEESLMDFLNSVPPPSQAQATPAPLRISNQTAKTVQRRNSASMRSRFSRSGSSSNAVKTISAKSGSQTTNTPKPLTSNTGGNGNTARTPQSPGIREEPQPLPQQPQSKSETLSSTSSTYGASADKQHTGVSKPIIKPALARPATRVDVASTRDLADFLKNSGPPEVMQKPVLAGPNYGGSGVRLQKGESGGFARMFSRRKRSIGMA